MTAPKHTRVALYLQDKHPIREGMAHARYAEEKGFEAVWQAESRLVRDAIVPMFMRDASVRVEGSKRGSRPGRAQMVKR